MKWLMFWRNKTSSSSSSITPTGQSEREVSRHELPADTSTPYFADTPLTDPSLDRFRRWPFAQRVAQTIAQRLDSSSLVIGIYGSWGEGKTTVFHYIQHELKKHPNIICVSFNPWRYSEETQLLRSFFLILAEALNKSITTRREEIGEALQKLSSLVTLLSDNVGSGLEGIGSLLSSVELETYKQRLERILRAEGKRIVILMDDIDRLDRNEIQAVFRLVKLSADFAYTAYILAFDEDAVADALGEKYGSGSKEAGYKFLEKIISVPLRLPRVDPLALRELCLEHIAEALKLADIVLTDIQRQALMEAIDTGLLARLQTPRMVKRYSNALVFALPILRGEVNSVDLILIEGMCCLTGILSPLTDKMSPL